MAKTKHKDVLSNWSVRSPQKAARPLRRHGREVPHRIARREAFVPTLQTAGFCFSHPNPRNGVQKRSWKAMMSLCLAFKKDTEMYTGHFRQQSGS